MRQPWIRAGVWGAVLATAALPMRVASAQQCTSGPECLQRWVGPIRPDPVIALVTGVVAAPIILAGGFVTAVKTASSEKETPAGVVAPQPGKKQRPELSLIPNQPAPPSGRVLTPEERERQEQAVRVNDAITNVGLAVGGAAVVGGIIYGIVKKK